MSQEGNVKSEGRGTHTHIHGESKEQLHTACPGCEKHTCTKTRAEAQRNVVS